MRERFSHSSRNLFIRPFGVLLAYECFFEATRGPVQIACGAPALTGRHLTESRDLSSSGLGGVVHPSESNLSARNLKRTRTRLACPARSAGTAESCVYDEPDGLREPPCAQLLLDRCMLFSIQPVSTEEHAGERAEYEKQRRLCDPEVGHG